MKGLPHLEVSVRDQLLEVLEDGKAIHSFPVSTSRFGTGFEEGSNCTVFSLQCSRWTERDFWMRSKKGSS